MAREPIVLSQEQQASTLASYLPSGKVFAAKNISGTNVRNILLGLAKELVRTSKLIALFRRDTVPDATLNYIEEWESALGIPDTCFFANGDDAERRLHIIVKLANYGVQTSQDFIDLAALFGVSIECESGSLHGIHGALPPKVYSGGDVEARNTIVIRPTEAIGESFPYTFPITFGTSTLATLECLFQKLKPAHVNLVFESV